MTEPLVRSSKIFNYTVKPVYNCHPWDSKKVAVFLRLRQRWSQFTIYSFKIAISFGKFGLKLAVADMWLLFRGGC